MIAKRNLPTFPEPLSGICMGTARLGGEYDESRSFELLDAYYAMGGRFLDTAAVYGLWCAEGVNASERVIGKWIRVRQITDMVVTTKGCHYDPGNPSVSRVSRECAEEDIEKSRQALGMDTLPIYLTHRDNPEKDVREIVDFLADFAAKGKITRFGFSNYSADRVRTALTYMGKDWRTIFVGVSNEWSLHEECLAAEAGGQLNGSDGLVCTGREEWELHREQELPLIPFSAAAHGFYDKVDPASLPDREAEIFAEVKKRSENSGLSRTAVSVAYLLRSGVPAIPVAAVSSVKQLEEFEKIAAFEDDLSFLSPFRRLEEPRK